MKPKRQTKTKPAPKRPGHPRLSAGEPSVRLNGIAPASLKEYAALIGGGEVSAGLRLALEYHRDNARSVAEFATKFDWWIEQAAYVGGPSWDAMLTSREAVKL